MQSLSLEPIPPRLIPEKEGTPNFVQRNGAPVHSDLIIDDSDVGYESSTWMKKVVLGIYTSEAVELEKVKRLIAAKGFGTIFESRELN